MSAPLIIGGEKEGVIRTVSIIYKMREETPQMFDRVLNTPLKRYDTSQSKLVTSYIGGKVFKNRPSKICGRQPL